jgi:tight adherence protein B
MPSFVEDNGFLVLSVLVFVAVVLMLEGVWTVWQDKRGPRARKLQRRLDAVRGGVADRDSPSRVLKQRAAGHAGVLDRHLRGLQAVDRLERQLQQAGLRWSASGVLLSSALCGIGAWVLVAAVLHPSPAWGAAAAALGALLPAAYVRYRRRRRLGRIEQQMPEALDLLARALRAGHAFTAGLKMAGEELADPVAGEFRAVHDEINFGVSMQQALTHLCDRVPSTDVRYFVVAVLIQRDSGGNLTEILQKLSHLIRERAKLQAKVRVLSSEGRMSAWVLTLLPFALGGALYLANPRFMGPMFTDPIGQAIVKYLLIMMALGVIVLRKIVRIRV